MTATPEILQAFHMTKKPGKKGRPPKPIEELAPPPIRRKCSWKKDGYVGLALCDILMLLNYRIRYTEEEFRFHHRQTGAFIFSATRGAECRNPWDALHARGDFNDPTFDELATQFARTAPVKK